MCFFWCDFGSFFGLVSKVYRCSTDTYDFYLAQILSVIDTYTGKIHRTSAQNLVLFFFFRSIKNSENLCFFFFFLKFVEVWKAIARGTYVILLLLQLQTECYGVY